ncbi:cytochrome c oxidase subunit 2 [Bacillus horti]|uniref:Cytochrome c oxidase subunit 2 n=1 Tax=Caldalkalibacillus horti TaxID=77523 RepID=A0ABT9VVA5_9BACI|nr:cytochrome c oxidase subunit 2 [Bacillus horti]
MKRLLPIVALALLLAGCGAPELSALNPSGAVAEKQLSLIILSISIMVLVFVVVAIIFTYVVIRYRERPGQEKEIPVQVEGNHKLEIIWTVIPILLLIVLAVPTVMTTFSLAEEAPEDAFWVDVTAHQYWWNFEYPDTNIVTAQELVIPTGERVYINLESADVIHSFWVPALAGKMDTNPDNTNKMYIETDTPGIYDGRCAELCGEAHALMNFRVVALEPAEYNNWVAGMQNFDEEVVSAQATEGRELFAQSCIGCHAVDASQPGLGPNLAGFAERGTIAGFLAKSSDNPEEADANLKAWIKEAQAVKPGNAMPNFLDLNDQELDAIVEYLNSLTLD